ncbi:MAG: methanogenesis marker 8 protein [Methanoregulaceae archaeon]
MEKKVKRAHALFSLHGADTMQNGMPNEDEHVIEAIGRCRVVIRDGEVVEVGPPRISRCPLARRFAHPVDPITQAAVKENIEHRIRSFGMCTDRRKVLMDTEFVGFGASELLRFALLSHTIDCAVIVCDGAGTIITTNPDLVQGVGGRMSGLVSTCPIPDVISRIEENGGHVIDHSDASIDQPAGVGRARALGFLRIGVTVTTADEALAIRELESDALIIAVHTTGFSREEAEMLARSADILTACASSAIREVAGRSALLQAGSSIPVFAMTEKARDLVLDKIRKDPGQVVVMGAKLPYSGDNCPEPLV